MKKVLLTGATGFIGRAAIPLLLSKGFEVHAVARTIPESNELAGLHWHSGDLLDHNTTEKLVAKIKPKYILHFASRCPVTDETIIFGLFNSNHFHRAINVAGDNVPPDFNPLPGRTLDIDHSARHKRVQCG